MKAIVVGLGVQGKKRKNLSHLYLEFAHTFKNLSHLYRLPPVGDEVRQENRFRFRISKRRVMGGVALRGIREARGRRVWTRAVALRGIREARVV